MKRILMLMLILTACTSYQHEEHTSAGSKYVLDNGLTIILKENPDTGITAADIMIKKTIAQDEKAGIGQFTTRLLLSGTTTRTKEDINKQVDQTGGTITTKNYAEYSEIKAESPSDQFSTILEIIHDTLQNPTFPPNEIEKERELILSEQEAKQDDPYTTTEELFMKTLYENHPYAQPIDGNPETIKQITREDIIQHYNKWYGPENTVIAITGNINEKTAIKAITKTLGKIKPKNAPTETIPQPQPILTTKTATQNMPLESYYIQYGYLLGKSDSPNYAALKVLNSLLGAGSGSRLFYELRDQQALAYSVYSQTPTTRNVGFSKITMITRPETLNASIKGITEQINKVKTQDIPEDELQIVKNKMKGFYFLDHQKTSDQANYLALYETQGKGYQYDKTYTQEIDNTTPEQIKYAANTYYTNPAIAIVGPFEGVQIK